VDILHDYIAGSKGSFKKTQIGLYNLAKIGAKIEIRTVVSRLNFNYLPRIAEHFYNYFPFCVHYAFMGMEVKGLADKNKDKLLISPIEFKQQLRNAVLKMVQRGLNVSIYNLPLCCIDEDVRSYACQSISTWKNSFIDKCEPCKLKEKCAGFFTTSSFIHVDDINPIA
jgi:MoaA/NifB/PqqE/SkfB family radical SAM enzyme